MLEKKDDEIEMYKLELGIAKAKKTNSEISGDSSTVTKLHDGKILVALSDGRDSRRKRCKK